VIGAPEWIDTELATTYGITPRQRDILIGIAKGMTNAEIARALFLSEDTVNTHTRGLFRNLKAPNRASAVAVAYDFAILRTRAMRIELAKAAGLRVAA
jgi:DNA-binding NarL/FixJ family response regulator